MAHKEAISPFLDPEGTACSSVDIIEVCEIESDEVRPRFPYALCVGWCTVIARRIAEDILYYHPLKQALVALLVKQDEFVIMCRIMNVIDENCPSQSSFLRLLTTSVTNNKTFRVAVSLHHPAMRDIKLFHRSTMPNRSSCVSRLPLH
jgi:hypothetical protein